MPLQSINPKDKSLIKNFVELTDEQIDQKISQADAAFKSWKETEFDERAKYLNSIAKELRTQKPALAKIITSEVGKTLSASEAEIEKCAITCEFYAQNAEKFLKPEEVETDASTSYVRFDPLGVVLAVMPWNFPLWQVFRFAAPALMAGNTGILKHASNVQLSAHAIEKIMLDAGLPEGVFVNLCIGSGKVAQVIDNDKVKAVTLTGSEKAGEAVASRSGKQIKKTVLELGGSDPFIVLEDADIDTAVEAAVTARLQYNGGQSCIAAKRFIVAKSVISEFEDKLKSTVEQLVVGDPTKPEVHVGPLANQQMVDDIDRQVKESVAKGAKVLCGGKIVDNTGYYYPPTIITNITFDMPVCNQETFGPIFAVIGVEDAFEAVKVANDSMYGLGASIFTNDPEKAMNEIAPKIDSGAIFINGPVKSDPRLPFGGVKKSGYGRELSHYGLKEFVNVKSVWVK